MTCCQIVSSYKSFDTERCHSPFSSLRKRLPTFGIYPSTLSAVTKEKALPQQIHRVRQERDRSARRVKRKRRDGKRRWRKLWPNDYRGLFSLSFSLDREKGVFRPYLSIRRHDLAAKVPKKDFRVLRRLSTLCFFFFFLCRSCFFPGLDCRQTSIFPKLLYFTSYGFLRFLAALQ